MRVCDFNSTLGRLELSLKALGQAWSETKKQWHDQTSKRFEDDHLGLVHAKVSATASAVSRLGSVLQQAEQELEDREQSDW